MLTRLVGRARRRPSSDELVRGDVLGSAISPSSYGNSEANSIETDGWFGDPAYTSTSRRAIASMPAAADAIDTTIT